MARKRLSYQKKKQRYGYVFILPWIIGFLMFFARPVIESIYFSFSQVRMTDQGTFTATYVGFRNYLYLLLEDPNYLRRLTTTLTDLAYEVPIILVYSLFIAVILSQPFRGRTFFRAVFFLPVIVASGVVMLILKNEVFSGGGLGGAAQNVYLFQSSGLEDILRQANIPNNIVSFLTDIVNRIFTLTWKSGVQILLFLASLQNIPESHYEAAKIEGSSAWDTFWKITIPTISPIILLNIVYTLIDTFVEYGTEHSGNQMMHMIYQTAFQELLWHLSAAQAWFYFLIIGLILAIVYRIIGRRVFYLAD
ncbi:MAG: sugar ABC transporter permease [Clostridia bacterium]|nr:sugar ABC transporter permease [Clostridia bacterium]